jgi:hypothetical protein
MAKVTRKTLDENGNLVDVAVAPQEINEVSDIKISEPIPVKKNEPKEYIFQLTQKFYPGNTTRPPYPENFFLRNTDIIFDEESGTERNIRYLEGVNTIFEDEQEHLSDAKKNQRPQIRFTNGYLRVPSNKTSLIKFLMSSNMFDKKKHRMESVLPVYTVLNFEEQEKQAVSKAEVRMSAMKLAMDAPVEVMIPHAQFLGLRFKNEYNVERTDKAIRVDYLNFADKNPDTFIKTYNNPLVKVRYIVNKAMNVGMIDITSSKGQAIWGDTKKFIVQIPDKAEPLIFLSEFCLTEKGKEFFAQLKSIAD